MLSVVLLVVRTLILCTFMSLFPVIISNCYHLMTECFLFALLRYYDASCIFVSLWSFPGMKESLNN